MRLLAPVAGFALGQYTASHPFSVAEGRDAIGPLLARRVRGEVDHDAVRVDVAHAAALMPLAGGIGGLELNPHVLCHEDRNGSFSLIKLGQVRISPSWRLTFMSW